MVRVFWTSAAIINIAEFYSSPAINTGPFNPGHCAIRRYFIL